MKNYTSLLITFLLAFIVWPSQAQSTFNLELEQFVEDTVLYSDFYIQKTSGPDFALGSSNLAVFVTAANLDMGAMFKVDSCDGRWDNNHDFTSYQDMGLGGLNFVHLIIRQNTSGSGSGQLVTSQRERVGRIGIPIINGCGTTSGGWVTGPSAILDYASNSIKSQANFIDPIQNKGLCSPVAAPSVAMLTSPNLCGQDTVRLTVQGGSTGSVTWYRDGQPLTQTTDTLALTLTGNYTAQINKQLNGCVCAGDTSLVSMVYKSSLKVAPQILLQGSASDTSNLMTTHLQAKGLLDRYQSGSSDTLSGLYARPDYLSSVAALPDSLVDVIKIAIRDTANPSVDVDTAFAWLKADGSVLDYETATLPYVEMCADTMIGFSDSIMKHVVIYHRNHLPVASVATQMDFNQTNIIDLRQTAMIYGGGHTLVSGRAAMIAANIINDEFINLLDLQAVVDTMLKLPADSYLLEDVNLDGDVNALDYDIVAENESMLLMSTMP